MIGKRYPYERSGKVLETGGAGGFVVKVRNLVTLALTKVNTYMKL